MTVLTHGQLKISQIKNWEQDENFRDIFTFNLTDSWLTLKGLFPLRACVYINPGVCACMKAHTTPCSLKKLIFRITHFYNTHSSISCTHIFLAPRSRRVKTWPVNHRVHTSSGASNCLKSIWSKSTWASAPIPAHPHHRQHQGLQSVCVQTARDSSASSAPIRSNNLQLLPYSPSAQRVLPWRSNALCSFSPWSIQIKRLQRWPRPAAAIQRLVTVIFFKVLAPAKTLRTWPFRLRFVFTSGLSGLSAAGHLNNCNLI